MTYNPASVSSMGGLAHGKAVGLSPAPGLFLQCESDRNNKPETTKEQNENI